MRCENCSEQLTGKEVLCKVCDQEGKLRCEECCIAEINHELDFEKKWKESQPRYTDAAYLQIFPGVKRLIPAKLKELYLEETRLIKAVKNKVRRIKKEAVSDLDGWLCREWLKLNEVGELLGIRGQTQRFERLRAISQGKKPKDLSGTIQKALQVSILDIAPLTFKKAGKDFVALCPFHSEKNPSFYVFHKDGREWFYCFGCQASGDVVDFVQHYRGCSFKDVLRELTGEKL